MYSLRKKDVVAMLTDIVQTQTTFSFNEILLPVVIDDVANYLLDRCQKLQAESKDALLASIQDEYPLLDILKATEADMLADS